MCSVDALGLPLPRRTTAELEKDSPRLDDEITRTSGNMLDSSTPAMMETGG